MRIVLTRGGSGLLTLLVGCMSFPSSQSPEELPANLDEAVAELRTLLEDPGGLLFSEDVVVGQCGEDGPQFTFRFTGPFSWQYDFFDAQSGEFLTRTQNGAEWTLWSTYWPIPITCAQPQITEVLGGERYEVGDAGDVLPKPL